MRLENLKVCSKRLQLFEDSRAVRPECTAALVLVYR